MTKAGKRKWPVTESGTGQESLKPSPKPSPRGRGNRFAAAEAAGADYSEVGTGRGMREELWAACFSSVGAAGVGVVQPQLSGEEQESQPLFQ
jgi:hypothetical protein